MGAGRDYTPSGWQPGRRKKPKRKQHRCASCGATNVKWAKRATGSFVLVDIGGGRHVCAPVTVDDFDDLTKG